MLGSWYQWIRQRWATVGAHVRARRISLALAAVLVAVLVLSIAQRAGAAIELAYYRGASTNVSVLLEWATTREVNLSGFEILCKRAFEPDTAYHPIGSRIAQGSPDTPATYSFNVTSGLAFGEAYCFRLREVTTDGTPGEQFDLCGYGPGITPPAADAGLSAGVSPTVTPTTLIVDNPGDISGPTFTPTIAPVIQGESPLATPTFDPFAAPTPTPILDQFGSPLSTPQAVDPNAGVAGNQENELVVTNAPTPTDTPTLTPTVTATPMDTPTPTATQPSSPLAVAQTGDGAPPSAPRTDPATLEPDPNALFPTPTPLYVVVTATPTPQVAAAVIQPTFTPWPTATAAPNFNLANLLVPSSQNMMVMLLCLIFLSASGLGVLGLVTSVLYMRSQARRARLPGPYYGRRRY